MDGPVLLEGNDLILILGFFLLVNEVVHFIFISACLDFSVDKSEKESEQQGGHTPQQYVFLYLYNHNNKFNISSLLPPSSIILLSLLRFNKRKSKGNTLSSFPFSLFLNSPFFFSLCLLKHRRAPHWLSVSVALSLHL